MGTEYPLRDSDILGAILVSAPRIEPFIKEAEKVVDGLGVDEYVIVGFGMTVCRSELGYHVTFGPYAREISKRDAVLYVAMAMSAGTFIG